MNTLSTNEDDECKSLQGRTQLELLVHLCDFRRKTRIQAEVRVLKCPQKLGIGKQVLQDMW